MLDQLLDRNVNTNVEPMTKEFFANVYSYMFAGLAITGTVAWFMYSSNAYVDLMFTEQGGRSGLSYLIMFSPLILVLAMSFGLQRFSMPVLLFLFITFSVLMGISISYIFYVYQMGSIFTMFLIAAGMFGGMAVLGYTTSTDLTKFGSLLIMVLWGMVLCSIINIFIGSDQLDWITSFIGIFVFTGLAAYEMQQLKYMAGNPELKGETRSKMALIGGLNLYLTFINLFLALLRVFGSRE